MSRQMRVVLADDHRLFRDGLRRLLELETDIKIVGEAKNGEETVQMVLAADPDIVLLDINMPCMDGGEVIRRLAGSSVHSKFVAITAYDDEEHLSALASMGINGYILKSSSMPDLMDALRAVFNGETYIDPKVAGKLISSLKRQRDEDDLLQSLTNREREVLYWLAQGLNNSEIADRMILSEKTVKNHVSHLLRKLNLNDRTKAAVMAWKIGIVDPSTPPPDISATD